MSTEYRFYSFVNFYLSQIQQGIQTGHASVELLVKYAVDADFLPNPKYQEKLPTWEAGAMVGEWAQNHKTYIILNGGDADGVDNAHAIIASTDLPFCEFYESAGALRGLKTCVGAVIPDFIFNAQYDYLSSRDLPKDTPAYSYKDLTNKAIVYKPGDNYYDLVHLLRRSRLA